MSKKTLGEAGGKFFMGGLNSNPDDLLLENQIRRRNEEKELEEAKELLMEAAKNKQEEINRKLQTLEILPMGSRIILSAYPENPYRKVVEGSIIVDWDGGFLNPDTGEMDKSNVFVGCANVIEVGPECKYLKAGDDVYYDTRTVYPLPFMSRGYVCTQEQGILAVVNEKLKERFKMN